MSTEKAEYQQLIEDNEINISELPSITQTMIAKYKELESSENQDAAQLDKLDTDIWNQVMDFIGDEEEEEESQQQEPKQEQTMTTEAKKEETPKEKPKKTETSEFPTAVKEAKKEEKKEEEEKPLFKKILGI
jgi:hypothetical protein